MSLLGIRPERRGRSQISNVYPSGKGRDRKVHGDGKKKGIKEHRISGWFEAGILVLE